MVTTAPTAAGDGEVAVSIHGLAGAKLPVGADGPTSFTVTWTNTTGHPLDGVAPVVAAQHYEGARCTQTSTAQGGLQRRDGSNWTELPLSQGMGMDYASSGDQVAFALAPGASRTISYQVALGADNGPGTLDIEADAYFPSAPGARGLLGRTVQPVAVVDEHRPKAAFRPVAPAPATSVAVGGPAAELGVSTANFTGQEMSWLTPRLLLAATGGELRPQDVTVEVMANGVWTKLPVAEDCDGLAVDASAVRALSVPTGRAFESMFRVSLAPGTDKGITGLNLQASAIGDGHYSSMDSAQLAVEH
ncbi:hypothetical protein ACFYNO_06535 [Kitasatospora sp. NPDC006697]|uniref:hypothetical protein n=1 Tax=Kitasatospora sp. NPDC006697 TaxID=3364020 RepID=UPI0036BECBFF